MESEKGPALFVKIVFDRKLNKKEQNPMNKIIQEILNDVVKKSGNSFTKFVEGSSNLDELIFEEKTIFKQSAKKVVQSELELVDKMLIKQSQRKGWQIHDVRERHINTELGEIVYRRHYYNHTKLGYAYMLDRFLSLNPYQRLTIQTQADVISRASKVSYQETINTLPELELYSKSTVMRVIRRYNHFDLVGEDQAPRDPRSVKSLFIEADEGHLKMQPKGTRFSHLIVVHEGWYQKDKSHKALINKHVFGGDYTHDVNHLWNQVLDYLDLHYDLDMVKNIYVSGDGAAWIKQGADTIPHSQFILDNFHAMQALHNISLITKVPVGKLTEWVNENKRRLFFDLIKERLDEKINTNTELTRLEQLSKYIRNNWSFISLKHTDDFKGTNMEGQVSHIIADRMTSRPMCWSIIGGDQMGHWRSLIANGISVLAELNRQNSYVVQTEQIAKIDGRVRKHSGYYDHIGAISGGIVDHHVNFKQEIIKYRKD